MTQKAQTMAAREQLQRENEELRAELAEAQDTLRAIREGEVDAVVVTGAQGDQIFSLVGADSVYRLIVETMKEAAFTLTFDGTILFCNAQFGQFVKRPLEQIVGRPLEEFIAPDHRAAAGSLLAEVQRQSIRRRLVLQDSEDQWVPVHVSANVLHQPDNLSICVVATDLRELEESTELIQRLRVQQEALHESESRFKAVFQGSLDAMVIADDEGYYVDANPAAEALLGLPMEELIGSHISRFLDTQHNFQAIWKAFREQRRFASEIRLVRSNGQWVDVESQAVADILPGRHLSVLRDITDRKRAEEALRQTAEELERSNRDLEQFAYVASHDLQEPLRMVTGFMRLLEERCGQLDDTSHEYIDYAVDGAGRMQQMIADLLTYSRVGTQGKQPVSVDVGEVLEYAKANLRATIDETQAVIESDPLPTIEADPAQLRQLLQNLLSNALKFRAEDRRPEVHIGVCREDRQWVFHVRDNGIGVEPRQHERMFMLFQRLHTREKYPGSGIGLAVCKKIVERHGGRIWVESAPEEGTTFFFTFPVAG